MPMVALPLGTTVAEPMLTVAGFAWAGLPTASQPARARRVAPASKASQDPLRITDVVVIAYFLLLPILVRPILPVAPQLRQDVNAAAYGWRAGDLIHRQASHLPQDLQGV